MPFEGTAAIVTGGASGLGLAITEALAARGTKVAIFDIQADAIDAEVTRLRAAGGTVSGHVVDVSSREQVAAAVARVRDEFGPVLILVNSAGIEQFGKFADITDEFWDRVMIEIQALMLRLSQERQEAFLPAELVIYLPKHLLEEAVVNRPGFVGGPNS